MQFRWCRKWWQRCSSWDGNEAAS